MHSSATANKLYWARIVGAGVPKYAKYVVNGIAEYDPI